MVIPVVFWFWQPEAKGEHSGMSFVVLCNCTRFKYWIWFSACAVQTWITVFWNRGSSVKSDILKCQQLNYVKQLCNLLFLRCSPARGYRLPSSALINLSHGSRSEMGNQKLMAIVKPQPAVNNCNSYASDLSSVCLQKVHLGGLNHSPRSLFVPTQVRLFFHSIKTIFS